MISEKLNRYEQLKNIGMTTINESTGLHRTPYADYWYLREGDFRPERITEFNGGNFSTRHTIPLLKEAGNFFPTKEEAAAASDMVRKFLLSINSQQWT